MDFSLNEEQRGWQMEAREFARRRDPAALARARPDRRRAASTWDWDIIEKGSKLGFRTLAVPKEWGGPGTDFVTQALVMAELAQRRQRDLQGFQPELEVEPSHRRVAARRTRKSGSSSLSSPTTRYVHRPGEHRAQRRLRQPLSAAPTRRKPGWRLRAERKGDEWMLNGEKSFIANGSVGKLFFVSTRTNPEVSIREGTTAFLVPHGHARLSHRQGLQQARLALLPERRAHFRERARAARERRRRSERRRRRRAADAAGASSAISSSRRTRSACATPRARCAMAFAKTRAGAPASRSSITSSCS